MAFSNTRVQVGRIAPMGVLVLAFGFAAHAQGQTTQQCENQCKVDCNDAHPLDPRCPTCAAQRAACIAACDKRCQPAPPVQLHPRYLILSLVYAPPGCTGTATNKCAAVSQVVYASSSSNGIKTSTNSSFKAGFSVTADSGLFPTGWNASAGYQLTQTDSTSMTVTKKQTNTIVASGNGDDIDHTQDTFVVLLNPVVDVQQQASNVLWDLGFSGNSAVPYTLTVEALQNPSSMNANVAKQLAQLGFTTSDFQTILAQDPFANGGSAIDSNRYTQTTWTFPYEPASTQSDCNNGVCNCLSFSEAITNELQGDVNRTYENQYSVGLQQTVGIPDILSLKSTESFTWTIGAATENTTDSSQSASTTVSCPSPDYAGPTLMQIYWDALYGSFLFVPFDLTNTVVVHKGTVTNTAGKPVRGQLVNLAFGGKTYHTFTGKHGNYQFVMPSTKARVTPATGSVSVKSVRQTVPLHSSDAAQIRIP